MSKYFNSKTSTINAFREIILECIVHIEKNSKNINENNPEFLHQIRVELRKLYISMQLLTKLLPEIVYNKQFTTFKQLVKQYESSLNLPRDWDVFSQYTLPQIISQLKTNVQQYKIILKQANQINLKTHQQMIHLIASKNQLWSDLKTWLNLPNSLPSNNIVLKPIAQISYSILQQKRKQLRAKLALEQMTEDQQHKLRIFIKKYHYTLNFFARLYKIKNVTAYLKILKQLQEILGAMHDFTIMRELCDELLSRHSNSNQKYIIAIGKIIGYQACQINLVQSKFDKRWHKLCKLKQLSPI